MRTVRIGLFFLTIMLAAMLAGSAIAHDQGSSESQQPSSAHAGSEGYEFYLNLIAVAPDEAETNYAENVQGITHNADSWFISQEWGLWKIPVSVHLADDIECGKKGVACANMNVPQLSAYDHIGDIDYYQFDSSRGYLLLPLEEKEKTVPSAIAIFDAQTLQYIDHAILSLPAQFPQPMNAPWVAVNRTNGQVYTTYQDRPGWVFEFDLDWKTLASGSLNLTFVPDHEFQLLDEAGVPLGIGGQGAVFSDSGDLLYVNNGYFEEYDQKRDGISVFDMDTKGRVAKSTRDCAHPFCYDYATWGEWEEPEGLTLWDLDDHPSAPQSMKGQLHVLLLDNDWLGGDDDDVYVMHYSNKIFVDGSYSGGERGTPTQPFNSVQEAHARAWNGSIIQAKAGHYAEAVTLSKRVKMVAEAGTVVIGE